MCDPFLSPRAVRGTLRPPAPHVSCSAACPPCPVLIYLPTVGLVPLRLAAIVSGRHFRSIKFNSSIAEPPCTPPKRSSVTESDRPPAALGCGDAAHRSLTTCRETTLLHFVDGMPGNQPYATLDRPRIRES